jgi:hypothetical protein
MFIAFASFRQELVSDDWRAPFLEDCGNHVLERVVA